MVNSLLVKNKIILTVPTCTNISGFILIILSLALNNRYRNMLLIEWLNTYTCKLLGVIVLQALFMSTLCVTLLSINKTIIITVPLRRREISEKYIRFILGLPFAVYFVSNITFSYLIDFEGGE